MPLPWRELAAGAAAGLCLRLFLFWFIDWKNELSDAAGYDTIARNLLESGVFSQDLAPPIAPSLYRPPIFPGFLAFHYALFGHSFSPALVTQSILSIARCGLLGAAVARANPRLGRWVFWILILSPFDAVYDVAVLTESLTNTLLVAALSAPLLLTRGLPRWMLMGALLGFVALTRDVFLALIPLLGLSILLFRLDPRRIMASLLVVGAASAVIAPWTIRNHAVTGRWVAVTEGLLGRALWAGSWSTHPIVMNDVTQYEYASDLEREAVTRILAEPDSHKKDKAFLGLALERYRTEPVSVVLRWLARSRLMWLGTRFEIFDFGPQAFARGRPSWYVAKSGLYILNVALLLSGSIGLVLALRRRDAIALFAIPVVYNFAVFLPLNSWEQRYSQPSLPFLAVFAAFAVLRLRDWWETRRDPLTLAR